MRLMSCQVLLLAALGVLPAHADLLELNWNSCSETAGVPMQSFACNTSSGAPFDLIYSINPFTPMSGVTGADIHVWLQSSQSVLPSWWRLDAAGCRSGALSVDATGPYPAGCADPWLGAATVTADMAYLACRPDGLQIDLHARLPEGTTRSLSTGTRYAMFRLRVDRSHTSGAGACGGCNLIASFGVAGISIRRSDGLGWSMSPAAYAAWQSTASPYDTNPNCGPTSVRTPTWGTIKSLYR